MASIILLVIVVTAVTAATSYYRLYLVRDLSVNPDSSYHYQYEYWEGRRGRCKNWDGEKKSQRRQREQRCHRYSVFVYTGYVLYY